MRSTLERQTVSNLNSTSPNPSKKNRYFDQIISLTQNYSNIPKSDYSSIKETLKKWARDKYNTSNFNELAIMKKQLTRGQCLESPEPKPKPKVKQNIDVQYEVLKKEHKIKEDGMHIMRLPKLPYGRHQTYNEEKEFIKSHFISESVDMSPEKGREIEDLRRKFRLQNKKFRANDNRRCSLSPSCYANMLNYDLHYMKAGTLVCQKEANAISAYEQEKQKFDKNISAYHASIKRRLSQREKTIQNKLRKKTGVISDDVKSRIYASVSQDFSQRNSCSLLSKYSPLFEDDS